MANAPLTVSTGCWFAISSILGATVLVVGLAPPPVVLFLGVPPLPPAFWRSAPFGVNATR